MPLPTIPEYSVSIKTPALVYPSILKGGHPIEKGFRLVKYSGGFCVVFPYLVSGKKYAVRCWHAEVSNTKERSRRIAEALRDAALPYFVEFMYYEKGIMTPQGIQPLVVMDWVEAQPLKTFLAKNIHNGDRINQVAEKFKTMVADLHENHISHGDLQHGNIMVREDNQLVLVDYDSMFVPGMEGEPDDIKGLVGYQHTARWKNKEATDKADYFSELVIYISLKALAKKPELWDELKMEDTETLLFSGEDVNSGGKSDIFQKLSCDTDFSPLIEKLCDFMSRQSIQELEPLEEAVIPLSQRIADKWSKGNDYSLMVSNIENSDNISDKWRHGNGFVETQETHLTKLVSSISDKFKSSY